MTDKELMQMALDALIDAADSQNWEMQQNIDQHGEWYRRSVYLKQSTTNSQAAIEALRIRLSQCERCGEKNPAEIHTCSPQEPVAWFCELPDNKISIKIVGKPTEGNWKPLYTAPPQREWQGLTDEEIREFEIWLDDEEEKHGWNLPADIVKYIEAKLKEKNSA
jgi:hypothetical protein